MDLAKIETGEGVRNLAGPVRPAEPKVAEQAKAVEAPSDAPDREREDAAQGQGASAEGEHKLAFSVDKVTHEVVAKIVDSKTGEVVRELPPEELRKAEEALAKFGKKLFDKIA